MGKQTVSPSALQLNSDKLELISAKFVWGSTPSLNSCLITYKVMNDDRTDLVREIEFNVTSTAFATLVSGYGATLESNLETAIWQDIQSKFVLVP